MAKYGVKKKLGGKPVAKKEPTLSGLFTAEQEKVILDKLFNVIAPSLRARDSDVAHFSEILTGLAAKNSGLDSGKESEEAAKYKNGSGQVLTNIRYPKTFGHVQDIAVNIMQVMFPVRQMYGSIAVTPTKQKESAAFVSVMNTHAKLFRHYTQFYLAIWDGIAYNRGIVETRWATQYGWKAAAQADRRNLTERSNFQEIRAGNAVRKLDVFNTILDYSAEFSEYSDSGNFYGVVERFSDLSLKRMANEGKITLSEKASKGLRRVIYNDGSKQTVGGQFYDNSVISHVYNRGSSFGGLYHAKGDLHSHYYATAGDIHGCEDHKPREFNLGNYLGRAASAEVSDEAAGANEMLRLVIRVIPKELGLGPSDDIQIWEFKILNGLHIVGAKQVATAHGYLPCSITTPKSELDSKSGLGFGEMFSPFQEGANSFLNIFLRHARSENLGGKTLVSSQHVNPMDFNNDAAVIPVDLSDMPADKRSIDHVARQFVPNRVSNAPIEASAMLRQSMQDIFPTNVFAEMAALNRPVAHQSRSVAALGNTHTFVHARIIHEQMVSPANFIQTQNIIHRQESLTIFDQTGTKVEIDPSIFRNAELDIAVSDGLRGVDTIAIADRVENLLKYMYQSGRLQSEFDLPKMTTYLLNMEGASIDMDAFRYQNEFDKLEPEQKQIAFQLLQQLAQQQQEEQQNG